ncbi:ABC transporter permease [Granulicoccus phenolivorans]|uniref:ABC transporter permease n=1 Tax=Granulicoccus phenolivorans TaxID=266854 RepID=UPI00040DB17D|nr:ABC transporter permease [Granulicoccus phenolivorans]
MSGLTALRWRSVPWQPGRPVTPWAARGPRLLALVVLALIAAWAVFGAVGYQPLAIDYSRASLPPSAAYWFGTDPAGRSVFAATAAGLRISLTVALLGAAGATVLGLVLGTAAGASGGRVDAVVVWLIDVAGTVPHLIAGIVIVVFFRGSIPAMVLAIALTHWPQLARVVRSALAAARSSEVVWGALALGATRLRLARHFLVPAVVPHAAAAFTLMIPHAIWHEATLSFLGVGLQPHQPSLGVQLNVAQQAIFSGAWWQLAVPVAALVSVTVAITALARPGRGRSL